MAGPSLPRTFWLIWVGTLINRLGGFVVPLLTFYLTDQRGLRASEAGLVVALFGAGQLLAAVAGGALADRIGRKRTMVGSLLAGAAFMLVLGLVRSTASIAAAVFALGLVGELYRPAVWAMVSDVVPAGQRARAFAALYWAINLAFAIAPIVGGHLARVDYGLLFVVDAATMAAFALVIVVWVPESLPAPVAGAAEVRLLDIARDRTFMGLVGLSFVVGLIFILSGAPLSEQLRRQGYDAGDYGWFVAINGGLIVLLQASVTRAVERRDPSRVLAVAAALTGLGFAGHALGPAAWVHAGAIAAWTLGEILASPINSSMVAALAPVSARGRYQGVFAMSWGAATMAGPVVGTLALDHGLGTWLWGSCAGLGLLAGLGHWRAAAARRRRIAAA
ncbi:MAG: MFS transporter [Kofleriaceae bacterium]|nr:MFS transporter [Kofleriaceae bacterium]